MTHLLKVFSTSAIFAIFAVFIISPNETSQGLTPLGHLQICIRLPIQSGYILLL